MGCSSSSAVAKSKPKSPKDFTDDLGASSRRTKCTFKENLLIMRFRPLEDDYIIEPKALGFAGMGCQVRAVENKRTKDRFACKTFDLEGEHLKTSKDRDNMRQMLKNEIELLSQLDHPNIISPFEVYESNSQLHMLMQLCTGGDLGDRKHTEAQAARVVGKILSAIAYSHRHKVCHRDLKMENVLYETKHPNSEVKLIDYGLSKRFVDGQKMTEKIGTPYTIAPEVLLGQGYTSRCDMWSVGCITFNLLAGRPPFDGPTDEAIIQKLAKVDYKWPPNADISALAKNFVKNLLVFDPKRRWSANRALIADWLVYHRAKLVQEYEANKADDSAASGNANGDANAYDNAAAPPSSYDPSPGFAAGNGDASSSGSGGDQGKGRMSQMDESNYGYIRSELTPPTAGQGQGPGLGDFKMPPEQIQGTLPPTPKHSLDQLTGQGGSRGQDNDKHTIKGIKDPAVAHFSSTKSMTELSQASPLSRRTSFGPKMVQSMRKFSTSKGLRKIGLMVIAYRINPTLLSDLRHSFQEIDTERTGYLSRSELRAVLLKFGVANNVEINKLFEAMDVDQSGRINFIEFLGSTIEVMGDLSDDRILDAFNQLDVDQSGFITAENLKEMLGRNGNERMIETMIKEADIDMSGTIDFEEFRRLMRFTEEEALSTEIRKAEELTTQIMASNSANNSSASNSANESSGGNGSSGGGRGGKKRVKMGLIVEEGGGHGGEPEAKANGAVDERSVKLTINTDGGKGKGGKNRR